MLTVLPFLVWAATAVGVDYFFRFNVIPYPSGPTGMLAGLGLACLTHYFAKRHQRQRQGKP